MSDFTTQPFTHFKDGCFFIDGTGLGTIEECPQKANLQLIRQRRRVGDDAALRFGKFIHEALAYRNHAIANGHPWTEEEQIKLLVNLFADSPCENEDWRNVDFAKQVIQHYNEQFALEEPGIYFHNSKAVVEHSLAIDTRETILGWRIIYIGRIDYLCERAEGLFVYDYKTTSVLGENFWLDKSIDESQRGYCWAIKQSLGIEPCGYIIRALAFRKPTRTGTCIEFETQRFFIKEPPGQLNQWYQNMMSQVEVFLWHHQRGKFPFFHKACMTRYNKPCEFWEMCNTNPTSGDVEKAREAILMGNGFKNNDWSPLTR